MNNAQKITILRTLIPSSALALSESNLNDILLNYLKIAERIVLSRIYPFNDDEDEVPERYEYDQIQIANYLITKRGADFETVHNENGTNISYEASDIPPSILNRLVPHGHVIGS